MSTTVAIIEEMFGKTFSVSLDRINLINEAFGSITFEEMVLIVKKRIDANPTLKTAIHEMCTPSKSTNWADIEDEEIELKAFLVDTANKQNQEVVEDVILQESADEDDLDDNEKQEDEQKEQRLFELMQADVKRRQHIDDLIAKHDVSCKQQRSIELTRQRKYEADMKALEDASVALAQAKLDEETALEAVEDAKRAKDAALKLQDSIAFGALYDYDNELYEKQEAEWATVVRASTKKQQMVPAVIAKQTVFKQQTRDVAVEKQDTSKFTKERPFAKTASEIDDAIADGYKLCKFNETCWKPNCTFMHTPAGSLCDVSGCRCEKLHWVEKEDEKCIVNTQSSFDYCFSTGWRVCKYNEKCTYKGCKFLHIEAGFECKAQGCGCEKIHRERCKFGGSCYAHQANKCKFLH